MASRSVLVDKDFTKYFELSVPAVDSMMRLGMVKPVLTHYGGPFADCNIYILQALDFEHWRVVCGCDALSEIREVGDLRW